MDVPLIGQGRHNEISTKINKRLNDRIQLDNNDDHCMKDDVIKAIEKLNKFFKDKDTYVEYEIYGRFKDITIKIINKETREIEKEIPPKKLIDMVEKLCELAGLFMDERA